MNSEQSNDNLRQLVVKKKVKQIAGLGKYMKRTWKSKNKNKKKEGRAKSSKD